ncbi:uncharacterized protein At2g34160-like isoform X1 [Solanum pennellii]|uniref:Uncharacterized protein At2g34160-like isoform X1 n=1 Tax=Solanum pennellii TaxID=28526 RepID=A0ABM1VBX3_SOLPN|nr:uncharacterized protein At2g34160-like isoform X1 [Solanum pennellii]
MEGITEGVNKMSVSETQKKNRIQVSNTKKSLFFYVNLSKRYMQQYDEVELSALGMAISTVVTIAEILKNNGFAVEKSEASLTPLPSLLLSFLTSNFEGTLLAEIRTLTVDMRDEPGARPIPKAKIEIVLGKTEKFDELMAAEAEQNGDNEEQQN